MNCFVDVETSGLDPKKNAILQLAAIVRNGNTEHTFNKFLKPFADDKIHPDAVKKHGLDPTQSHFLNPWAVYRDFIDFLKGFVDPYNKKQKLHFMAYNSQFDSDFIRNFFEKNGDKFYGSYFWYPDICVCRLAGFHLRNERSNLKNFKLQTVAEYLKIETKGNKLHDALYDIELTMEIWDKVK
jgi:DNA polymerase-3 subunit epsilon